MRPRYESEADRRNEREIIDVACRAWNCEAYKLPIAYKLDFALIRDGRIHAFAEVKKRTCKKSQYPTFMLAYQKVLAARQFSVPTFLIVGWVDQIGFARFDSDVEYIGIGGRRDRADADDVEPQAFFNVKGFKKIE